MKEQYSKEELAAELEVFGLTTKQAKVYLAALQLGASSIQNIALKAQVERTNAYDAVQHLIDQHLLATVAVGKRRLFVAEPPEAIRKILSEKESKLQSLLPELRSLHNLSEFKPRIKYYPGVEGYKTVYEDTLTTTNKRLFGIYSNKSIIEVLGESYINDMVKRRVAKGIFLQTIHPRSNDLPGFWGTSDVEMREVRLAPHSLDLPIVSFAYDNKVVNLSSKNETFGLIIESQDMATAQLSLFQSLWQISTPIAEIKIK
jgi:sugar-specific transcriptional regulator TrmB